MVGVGAYRTRAFISDIVRDCRSTIKNLSRAIGEFDNSAIGKSRARRYRNVCVADGRICVAGGRNVCQVKIATVDQPARGPGVGRHIAPSISSASIGHPAVQRPRSPYGEAGADERVEFGRGGNVSVGIDRGSRRERVGLTAGMDRYGVARIYIHV